MPIYRLLNAFFIFFLSIFLLSCATNVSSLKEDKDVRRGENEGYLLLAIDSQINLYKIFISGPKDIALSRENLRAGSNYILLNLPAGTYRIKRAHTGPRVYFELNNSDWDFTVKPQVISYVGHLKIQQYNKWFEANFELINRSSSALEYLEKNFPHLLETRTVEYSGLEEDRFLSLVTSQKEVQGGKLK